MLRDINPDTFVGSIWSNDDVHFESIHGSCAGIKLIILSLMYAKVVELMEILTHAGYVLSMRDGINFKMGNTRRTRKQLYVGFQR